MDIERITLTKGAKALLRALGDDASRFGTDMLQARESAALELERKGLVRCAWVEGRKDVDAVRLTLAGDYLLTVNPSLRPPIAWQVAEVLLAIIKRLIVIVALAVLLAHYKLV